ncbi:hypothetical protein AMR41_03390 [Hapalosiphon sp. MRB220]|nr:hypothetical protein AMR41_03390 [Hapalosiphon sp. MRB220]
MIGEKEDKGEKGDKGSHCVAVSPVPILDATCYKPTDFLSRMQAPAPVLGNPSNAVAPVPVT